MWKNTSQDEESLTLEMRDPKLSYIEPKITNQKETTKQKLGDRNLSQLKKFAAAQTEKALEEKVNQKGNNPHSADLSASDGQNKTQSALNKLNTGEEINVGEVDYIINKNWKALIPLLDSVGVPINRTIKDLLKLYPAEKVESAIALLKARKRESCIPNSSGYFVSALKGDWASTSLAWGNHSLPPLKRTVNRESDLEKGD
ncbi:MAG: hypothetical protein AAGF26_17170 [Cyanobacteria bacterium P01_G01_bin.49]